MFAQANSKAVAHIITTDGEGTLCNLAILPADIKSDTATRVCKNCSKVR